MDQEISLDVKKRESSFGETRLSPMRRGERGNCALTVRITADGEPYDLTGKTVRFSGMTGLKKLVGTSEIEMVNPTGGVVRHSMPNEMALDVGAATGYYEIYQGDDYLDTTAAFVLRVMPCNDLSAESAEDYAPLVNELVIATTRANDASASATASAGAAAAASESASKAAADASAAAKDSRAAEAELAEADRQREARQQKNDSDQAQNNAAEEQRIAAEEARVEADLKRDVRQLKNDSDQAQNNAAAKGLTYHVCGTGEYALDSVDGLHNIPTITGKSGVMYLTPKVKGATSEDSYDQWMLIDGSWELMGETGAHVDPTTTDDIDTIVSGSTVTADRYLNAAGLTYFWTKAKAKLGDLFAARSHKHATSDMTGTLAIANGGTGASTAADALASLGAASASDVEALRESVSQDGIWTIFRLGKLCVCTTDRYVCPDNAYIQSAWGNVLESQDLALPDYPVAFERKPWLNVAVVDCDPGTTYVAMSIEYTYSKQSATSAGSVCLTRPSGTPATIGHPVLAITAIGTLGDAAQG